MITNRSTSELSVGLPYAYEPNNTIFRGWNFRATASLKARIFERLTIMEH